MAGLEQSTQKYKLLQSPENKGVYSHVLDNATGRESARNESGKFSAAAIEASKYLMEHAIAIEELCQKLQTNLNFGLPEYLVQEKLQIFGPNKLTAKKRIS